MFDNIKKGLKKFVVENTKKELYYSYCVKNNLKINLKVTILPLSYLEELQWVSPQSKANGSIMTHYSK